MFNLVDMDTGRIIDESDFGNIAEHHMVLCEAGRNVRVFEKSDVHQIVAGSDKMTVITAEGGQLEALVIVQAGDGEIDMNEILDIKDARNIWKGFIADGGEMVQ